MSCHGWSRRCAARGRNASEWRRTAAADSIRPSVKRLRPMCSTIAIPVRVSCSRLQSSRQLRETIKGSGGWWWDIGAGSSVRALVAVAVAFAVAVLIYSGILGGLLLCVWISLDLFYGVSLSFDISIKFSLEEKA